jgi:hypothetical protein
LSRRELTWDFTGLQGWAAASQCEVEFDHGVLRGVVSGEHPTISTACLYNATDRDFAVVRMATSGPATIAKLLIQASGQLNPSGDTARRNTVIAASLTTNRAFAADGDPYTTWQSEVLATNGVPMTHLDVDVGDGQIVIDTLRIQSTAAATDVKAIAILWSYEPSGPYTALTTVTALNTDEVSLWFTNLAVHAIYVSLYELKHSSLIVLYLFCNSRHRAFHL